MRTFMNSPETNDVLLKDREGWLYFTNPLQVIVAESLQDVPGALREVERLVETQGCHAAGFLSYEAAPAFDPALLTHTETNFPYLWFGLYSQAEQAALPQPSNPKITLDWHPTVDRDAYNAAIDRIRDYIARGRTYQVNYTLRLQTQFDASPWEFFLQLVQNQNHYAAFVDTGRYAICSASPELFFELDGNRITSRPMKGTAARGRTSSEDKLQAERLKNSEKNRAENIMIVDMIRNDLGKIAKIGSVRVPEQFCVERYPTLWQMTSTVSAETDASLAHIIGALFPCASITGAPKVSTMKIIHELENTPRKIYTGMIGTIAPGRKARFSVAIRTSLIDKQTQKAEYGVGSGIVWDSDNREEYAEALLKARLLTESVPRFSLFETMLWTPAEGFFLEDQHIERLLDSADYFDFPVSEERVKKELHQFSFSSEQPQRVRLLLDWKGDLEITSTPISFEERQIQVALADNPINSNDRFLFHKTTLREVYDTARASHPDCDDVLLYNERGEMTEFTIGNLVVELDGKLVTPPIECGLLPGTFRALLIETDQIAERAVPLSRLKECTKIYRVNSVRKWEPVRIN